jgi:hypothetical protein
MPQKIVNENRVSFAERTKQAWQFDYREVSNLIRTVLQVCLDASTADVENVREVARDSLLKKRIPDHDAIDWSN